MLFPSKEHLHDHLAYIGHFWAEKKKMKTISGKASEALSCGVSNEGMGYCIIDTLVLFIIKGTQSKFLIFFKLLDIIVLWKAHIFLITHGKFCNWKVFSLEDINENMLGYG